MERTGSASVPGPVAATLTTISTHRIRPPRTARTATDREPAPAAPAGGKAEAEAEEEKGRGRGAVRRCSLGPRNDGDVGGILAGQDRAPRWAVF